MYVLAFRDLSGVHSQGITPGQLLRFPRLSAATDWRAPASLLKRIEQKEAERIPWADAPDLFDGKRVCFIVHGFNVDRDRGYAGYGAMAQELLGLGKHLKLSAVTGADLVIPVLWPGDWYIPAINYPFEMGDVRETGVQFAAYLRGQARGAASVAFVSHSLGARVVLETVTNASQGPGAEPPPFELALLAAPAADPDELDNPRYDAGVRKLQQIIVVSSPDDEVLGMAFPAGNIVEAALWRGEKARSSALGRYGPKALKANSPAKGRLRWFAIAEGPADPCKHGDYFPSPWADKPALGGWNTQRQAFGGFLHKVFTPGPLQPEWPVEQQLRT